MLFVPPEVIIGEMKVYAGGSPPDMWLLCDGSDVSRAEYSELFTVLGTEYGTGDGSTTFGLPWYSDPTYIIRARR